MNEYGTTILYAVLVAVAGWLGTELKAIYAKIVNDQQKKDIVETCVKAAEQIYRDLHGEAKFDAMCADVSELAASRGVTITGVEVKMLAEAALCEFNRAFEG